MEIPAEVAAAACEAAVVAEAWAAQLVVAEEGPTRAQGSAAAAGDEEPATGDGEVAARDEGAVAAGDEEVAAGVETAADCAERAAAAAKLRAASGAVAAFAVVGEAGHRTGRPTAARAADRQG